MIQKMLGERSPCLRTKYFLCETRPCAVRKKRAKKSFHELDTVSQRTYDKYFLFFFFFAFSFASNREIDHPVGKKMFSCRYEEFAVKPQAL